MNGRFLLELTDSSGSPAAQHEFLQEISAGPVALRPTLSNSLPFTTYPLRLTTVIKEHFHLQIYLMNSSIASVGLKFI